MRNSKESATDETRLKVVLRQARPEMALPPGFQDSVWRRIERGELESERWESRPWLERLVASVLRPRLAIAGAVAILLFGGVMGAMDGSADARQAARDQYVAAVAPQAVR